MIYFNKLINICINRQESQKVVDNNFVGTNYLEQLGLPSCFFMFLNVIIFIESLITIYMEEEYVRIKL